MGCPTELYFAERLRQIGWSKIFLKREDLLHTGAQDQQRIRLCWQSGWGSKESLPKLELVSMALRLLLCAKFGLECVIYMGAEDMRRQALNVFRMRLSGAKVVGVEAGSKTLKEAINEAMRDWVTNVRSTHYILGSALGAHPYPEMVRNFHRVIGEETKRQFLEAHGQLPNELIACVGGGSNAIGFFHSFIDEENIRLVGVEAGGKSLNEGEHAARFEVANWEFYSKPSSQNPDIDWSNSLCIVGLDYGYWTEHAYRDCGSIMLMLHNEALEAFKTLASEEVSSGIGNFTRSCHAFKRAKELTPEEIICVNLREG